MNHCEDTQHTFFAHFVDMPPRSAPIGTIGRIERDSEFYWGN
jgi:hypothetical protein